MKIYILLFIPILFSCVENTDDIYILHINNYQTHWFLNENLELRNNLNLSQNQSTILNVFDSLDRDFNMMVEELVMISGGYKPGGPLELVNPHDKSSVEKYFYHYNKVNKYSIENYSKLIERFEDIGKDLNTVNFIREFNKPFSEQVVYLNSPDFF